MASPNLLLVDDDEHKRLLISHYLLTKFPTANIRQCRSGAEAIEQLQARKIDAVITDHSMVPVNGLELIRWTRQRFADLPIVMVTGHAEIEHDALRAGANQVVNSLDWANVGDAIEKLLADQARERGQ